MSLSDQLKALGSQLGEREAAHRSDLERANERAREFHSRVRAGLDGFHEGCRASGAEQLKIELSQPRIDDKRVHAVQFDVSRGRHFLIVTAKSKGEVTLVGPFKEGKPEGPCRSLPIDDDAAIDLALAEVLGAFIAEAFTP
jgi:hypothetical protein